MCLFGSRKKEQDVAGNQDNQQEITKRVKHGRPAGFGNQTSDVYETPKHSQDVWIF